jgi:hypothetical protein
MVLGRQPGGSMAGFGIDMTRFQGKPTRSIRKPGLLIPRYTKYEVFLNMSH